MDQETTLPPHVLIFPLPLQGPVNSMLKLAELLSISSRFHITFLVTDHIHRRLLQHTDIKSRFEKYPGFRLETISDGLSEEHPRSGDRLMELFDSLNTETKKLFRELLNSGRLISGNCRPITCIIADGIMGFTCDVANEFRIPIIYARTVSACCLWVFFCLPKLIEVGEIPFQGNDLDVPIRSVPGMEGYLRRRDLPSFCRSGNVAGPNVQVYLSESQENPRAHGLILNTFEDLEGPILSQIRTLCPNLYTIGPLHAHLKTKLAALRSLAPASSNSLWEEDRSCLAWLDVQPPKSVVYVSFGSLAVMSKDQLLEFRHGLVNSGQRFLWVIRPDSGAGEGLIPADTNNRGYIVGWAPQEEVLSHASVGAFLTHSGWNSTLEAIYEGKPMICWPYFLDQQVNSRFVEKVWGLGVDMKDICDRVVIEKMVRDLMDERGGGYKQNADQIAKLANECFKAGGSSYKSLENLVKDIELMMKCEH